MRLIAKKPCSFGGRKFFIGDEIPAESVADAKLQEKWGVVSIVEDDGGGTAVQAVPIQILVKGESDGENEQITVIQATPEEIQQVFDIMQMNTTEGAEAIAGVKSENVLILLHAADTRKTIKEATKKQADNLFSTNEDLNESSKDNETTGANTEGADT